ncbi:flagellar basal body L-ring protein FlgH [Oceanibium sediminis]|uniref:flagellar basal body L-ring protein FlgH n=1 Tax=Oceanibium sediminis TaxID=2026339 RepID=UPI000DD4E8E0|nr:flagellar basal body L-ring protein FlgH [Oceanibium sediminis]
MTRYLMLILCAIVLAGCARLDQVGKEPAFSPVGGPINPATSGLSPARAALAIPPPERHPQEEERASLWRSGPSSLFGDRRASRRGDILTVMIEIDDRASIQNSSSRARSGSESVGVPALAGIPQIVDKILPNGASSANLADLSSSSSSSGNGAVQRNEEITLRIAATVVDVLPNGHLVVQGNQEVRVNFELRDLQVAGIVRPEDISRQNQITYDKMAGARIAYGGRGQIHDVQQPRLGQQVADILLPF